MPILMPPARVRSVAGLEGTISASSLRGALRATNTSDRDYVLTATTTDGTQTTLTTDGAAAGAGNQIVLSNSSVVGLRIQVVGRESAGAGKALFYWDAMGRRDANATTTLVSNPTVLSLLAGTTTGWAATAAADTTNGAVQIRVTGAAGSTIKWVARVTLVEVVS